MAIPSYTTDLNLLTNAESGTWGEFIGYIGGGVPTTDDEYYIEGAGCVTQSFGNKSGAQFSIGFDNGTPVTINTDECFFMWQVNIAGNSMDTYAAGGLRGVIGADLTNFDMWITGGNDFGRNPYGGWQNVAIDPTFRPLDYSGGTGSGGSYRWFGSAVNLAVLVTKGNPHGVDVLRYGRGQAIITGGSVGDGYSTFAGLAAVNDTQTERWGLFQAEGTGYLWKGLMSFGITGYPCEFVDSNIVITVDDTPKTYADFNKIEINDSASNLTWTNVNISALNPTGLSIGSFIMNNNAYVYIDTCIFTDMNTFKYQSSATTIGSTFLRCNSITQSGSTFTNCVFSRANIISSGVTLYMDDVDKVTYCDFTSNGTGHAIEGFSSAGDYDLVGLTFSNYLAAATGNTGNEAVHILATSGVVNLNISGAGSTTFSIRSEGATVNIVAGAVTVYVKTTTAAGVEIQGARVLVYAFSGGTGILPYNDIVTIVNSGTLATVSHTGHNMFTNDKVRITGGDLTVNRGVQTITKIDDNSYSYVLDSAPGTSPTGTVYSTYVALEGTTDINGEISTSRVYSANQPVRGWARKSTESPLYKTAPISGEIDTVDGFSSTAVLISDE